MRTTGASMNGIKVCVGLVALAFGAGADCHGGTDECDPPAGLRLEEPYCRDGVRGVCREGGHPGDTVWDERPCPDGSACEMRETKAVCVRPDGTLAPAE